MQFTSRKLSLVLCLGTFLALSFATAGCAGGLGEPSASAQPSAHAKQHSVALSWSPSGSAVSGYNVYRGSQSGGPYSKLNSSEESSTTYSDTTVQAGATYFYVVTAVNTSSEESSFSNETTAVVPSH